jgi:hypothetical protein
MNDAAALLARLLTECVRTDASDLHLSSGEPPYLRIHGVLAPIPEHAAIPASILDELANELLLERPRKPLDEIGAMDGAFTAADGTRFRFNVFRRQNQLAIELRRLEDRFRTLKELGFPDSLHRRGQEHHARHPARSHQPDSPLPHRHHRRPDRVPAPAFDEPREPTASRKRHRELQRCVGRLAAAGSGRDPGG